MGSTVAAPAENSSASGLCWWALPLLLGAGSLLRLRRAWITFLNPDEALHYFLAHQPSLKLAYAASLSTAHPPLMIFFLHCWLALGSSELLLRLPFVIAGALFCWVMFLWIRMLTTTPAAAYALALFSFLPPLISLSAEIRQYSFLLFFCACCLYFLEGAIESDSAAWLTISAAFLYAALLTHYSALIFAATAGIYALVRLHRKTLALKITFFAGQIIALGIVAWLFQSQISKLRHSGMPSEIASTWLRSSIFHRGTDQVLIFTWSRTLRLFRYFFSQGTVGVLGFVLFVFAIIALVWAKGRNTSPRMRGLAMLFALPFFLTLGGALAGIYPYGGSRHDVILAIFAIPAIAVGFDRLRLTSVPEWLKPLLLGITLLICNLFPSPIGPYIRPRNQRRQLMQEAMSSLQSMPSHSVILTDAQGSMVLNYYLCGESMPLPFSAQPEVFLKFQCADYFVLDAPNTQAGFDRSTFPELLSRAWQVVPRETALYLFQSGWIDDKEDEWTAELRRVGGSPRTFGPNILTCRIARLPSAMSY